MFRVLIKTLLLPPALPLLAALLAFFCWWRWPRFSRTLLFLSIASLWLLSLPVVSGNMLALLERDYVPLTTARAQAADAIVILGGGRRTGAREYGEDTVNDRTLARLRYGAQVYRNTQLPILVVGGRVLGTEPVAEAHMMASILRNEFGVPVSWQETDSYNTAENARFSADILRKEGVATVVLVTHAWHMSRAQWAFEQAGLSVVPAPMAFTTSLDNLSEAGGNSVDWVNWLPSAQALQYSHWALHEWLGIWVYRLTETSKSIF